MLPLAGDQQPSNTTELANALQQGLSGHGVTASVKAEGGWPAISALTIGLSRIARPKALPKAGADASITIERLEISGRPVEVEGVPANVRADFSQLGCGFGRAGDGPWQLVIRSAGAGRLDLEAATADVEQALHRIVSEQAGNHGATVKSTKLNITSVSPRSVKFEVSCTAKVFIATATLTVVGQLDIDDQLNATLTGLGVTGDGMIASMAQGMIQPRLAEWNGRVVPLGNYVAAGLTVSDLRISTGDQLRLEATFGPAAG